MAERAKERLWRPSPRGAGWVLAYAAGDEITDTNEKLYTHAQITKAETDATAGLEATAARETAATAARATGDTYDRRALREGLPTEAEQKVADTAAATGEKAPKVDRPEIPTDHVIAGEGDAAVVVGSPEPSPVLGSGVEGGAAATATSGPSRKPTRRPRRR